MITTYFVIVHASPAHAASIDRSSSSVQDNPTQESQTQPESPPSSAAAHSQNPFAYPFSALSRTEYSQSGSQLPLLTQKPYHYPSQDSGESQESQGYELSQEGEVGA